MEGREQPNIDKYKAIKSEWNYDACCTSLPVWDRENFKRLSLVAQSVQSGEDSYQSPLHTHTGFEMCAHFGCPPGLTTYRGDFFSGASIF
jgi:hypothetical protein